MLILSYLGHAYVWGDIRPVSRLPASLARAWHDVAVRLGRPPVLSYALANWRRVDPDGPIALGNIVLLQNFVGGIDEEWFTLVHVDIEARAGNAMAAIEEAQQAVEHEDADAVETWMWPCVTCTDAHVVHQRTHRVVPNWSPDTARLRRLDYRTYAQVA